MSDFPSVTTIIYAAEVTPRYREGGNALEIGTAVDMGSRLLFEGYKVSELEIDPRICGYMESLEKWIEATGFQAEHIQPEFISQKYGIIGHPDVLSVDTVVDVKTGQKAKHYRLQTAAYMLLANEQDEHWIQKRGCLYAQKDGSIARYEEHRNNSDASAFLSALKLYQGEKALDVYRQNIRNWMEL